MKRIHVIGGGTFNHVRTHLALAAPAFGQLARQIAVACNDYGAEQEDGEGYAVHLHLTRMAYNGQSEEEKALLELAEYAQGGVLVDPGPRPTTNQDVEALVDDLCAKDDTAIIFLTAALCDFDGTVLEDDGGTTPSGKGEPRLASREGEHIMLLTQADKILARIRSKHSPNPRKDIFLVGCKTTDGVDDEEMFLRGLRQVKESSCNLVLVNDVKRRRNMIVTPEQARYCVTDDRIEVIERLVEMALSRAEGHFTRSTVVAGMAVDWGSDEVPAALRTVVNHCIEGGAYKDLLGTDRTVGHFAARVGTGMFLTSQRNTNFNRLAETGLVRVVSDGDDRVLAFGSKPSVGGQSQRQIFDQHPEMDCIFHAHIPLKSGAGKGTDGYAPIGMAPQWQNECGSHECGQNTSDNLREVAPGIKAVYLEQHGPNVVFSRAIDPRKVTEYLDATFDFTRHTGAA